MTDAIELKPCPFCGGTVHMEKVELRHGFWYGVVCRNTGNLGGSCAMDQVPSRTPEAAAGRWNMRKPMEVLVAENEALRDGTNFRAIQSLRQDCESLRKDAERYRWLRDSSESIHQFYLSTPIWFTGVKFSKENVDSTIDAAMGKELTP